MKGPTRKPTKKGSILRSASMPEKDHVVVPNHEKNNSDARVALLETELAYQRQQNDTYRAALKVLLRSSQPFQHDESPLSSTSNDSESGKRTKRVDMARNPNPPVSAAGQRETGQRPSDESPTKVSKLLKGLPKNMAPPEGVKHDRPGSMGKDRQPPPAKTCDVRDPPQQHQTCGVSDVLPCNVPSNSQWRPYGKRAIEANDVVAVEHGVRRPQGPLTNHPGGGKGAAGPQMGRDSKRGWPPSMWDASPCETLMQPLYVPTPCPDIPPPYMFTPSHTISPLAVAPPSCSAPPPAMHQKHRPYPVSNAVSIAQGVDIAVQHVKEPQPEPAVQLEGVRYPNIAVLAASSPVCVTYGITPVLPVGSQPLLLPEIDADPPASHSLGRATSTLVPQKQCLHASRAKPSALTPAPVGTLFPEMPATNEPKTARGLPGDTAVPSGRPTPANDIFSMHTQDLRCNSELPFDNSNDLWTELFDV